MLTFNILIALFQQASLLKISDKDSITGIFTNSGPFSIYLSILLCVPVSYLLNRRLGNIRKVLVYIVLIGGLYILFHTQSRSAFIGLFVATLFLLNARFSIHNYLFGKRGFIFFISILIFAIPFLYWLYSIKQSSADGRILIWYSTISLISDNLWSGVGLGKFSAAYMEHQGLVLSDSHMCSRYGRYAGDIRFAFNDYLQIISERGIVSLLCFILIPLTVIRYYISKQKKLSQNKKLLTSTIGAMLICILCSSFTSYPLQIIPIQLIFWSIVAIIAPIITNKKPIYFISSCKMFLPFLIILLVIIGYYGFSRTISYLKWNDITSDNNRSIPSLQSLKFVLSDNPRFLFDLANAYESSNRLEESIIVIEEIVGLNSYPEYFYALANIYERQGNFVLAREKYDLVAKRIPNLIRPHYLIAMQYYKKGDLYNFQKYGRIFLELKPKVNNAKSNDMKFDIYSKIMEIENKSF